MQLGVDKDKTWTWPAYVAVLRARRRCPVYLLVVAPSLEVARWAGSPIQLSPGTPGWRPLVLGPEVLPVATDPSVARHHPELTLLAALAQASEPSAATWVELVPQALNALDGDLSPGYASMVAPAMVLPVAMS